MEKWIVKDVEGISRGLIRGTIPKIDWRDWEKSWKPSIRITSFLAEISTGHHPNTSGNYHGLNQTARNMWHLT
jgi:hypothetical protein